MPSTQLATRAPPVNLPATLAECHALILAQAHQIELSLHCIAQFEDQLALVQERLSLDSKNSSLAPSSDGPASPNRAQRRASGRKRGAQVGHKGSYRALLDQAQVDDVVDCAPDELCECGAPVLLLGDEPIRHQVFDVPPVKAHVVEYRRYAGRCMACGKAHRAALPPGVPSGQIGPRALALVGTLGTQFQLTQMKIRDLLARLMGVDFSVGAISQAHGKVALALAAPVSEVAQFAKQSPVKHMDETRYPREGAGNWVWAVVTPKVAWYSLLPSRARYVATSLVGERFTGILVSDRYAVYDYVDVDKRQVCWAECGLQASLRTLDASRGVEPLAQRGLQGHLLRDFTRISQRQGLAGQVGRGLLGAGYLVFRWRKEEKTTLEFDPLCRRIKRLLMQGSAQTKCTRTAKTCANLLKLYPALWTFLEDAAVAPTNNEAERALRALVLKRKISGPTRSRRGDEFLANGFSVYETCRRQGRDLWDFMHQAVGAWIHKAAAPSLVPLTAASAPSG